VSIEEIESQIKDQIKCITINDPEIRLLFRKYEQLCLELDEPKDAKKMYQKACELIITEEHNTHRIKQVIQLAIKIVKNCNGIR